MKNQQDQILNWSVRGSAEAGREPRAERVHLIVMFASALIRAGADNQPWLWSNLLRDWTPTVSFPTEDWSQMLAGAQRYFVQTTRIWSRSFFSKQQTTLKIPFWKVSQLLEELLLLQNFFEMSLVMPWYFEILLERRHLCSAGRGILSKSSHFWKAIA